MLALSLFGFLSWSGLCLTTNAQVGNSPRPKQLLFSNAQYGPDGPWQAVTVYMGAEEQAIDLYPGGAWESAFLSPSTCTMFAGPCYASKAGFFNGSASKTFDGTSIGYSSKTYPENQDWPPDDRVGDWTSFMDDLRFAHNDKSPVKNLSSYMFTNWTYSMPNGKYPVEVGCLSLGAPDVNQTFTDTNGGQINASLVPSYLYQTGAIPSNSFGLHIGSVRLGITGSLWFGGYDQSRVLGKVASYGMDLATNLRDIGLGVGAGGSPWNFTSAQGLLAQGNSSITDSITATLNPIVPYMYLPKSTCDAIAKNLPVTYQPGYGVYFWNTSSPQYSRIMNSAAYLSFTFRSVASDTIDIKVPFILLNLTMEAPLVSSPTPYFPCYTYSPLKQDSTNGYHLGRAFLQAAFLGMNWNGGNAISWLAQAPGPNVANVVVTTPIAPSDRAITPSAIDWAGTWQGVWKTLPGDATSSSSPHSTSGAPSPSKTGQSGSGGLSVGAKAGIGIGSVAVVIGAAIFVALIIRRRGRTPGPSFDREGMTTVNQPISHGPNGASNTNSVSSPNGFYGQEPPKQEREPFIPQTQLQELSTERGPFELPIYKGSSRN